MYDVIVIGARCAGSPTAMLLARKGYKVLLVDRATFPSDIPHGHFIHRGGPRALQRWGLLDRIVATGCPPVTSFTLDLGDFPLVGSNLEVGGVAVGYAPRRSVLDAILVDAAAEAGAEVRTGFTVDDLLIEDGRVVGIRGRDVRSGAASTERARIIVGADGRNSRVARLVGAANTEYVPPVAVWYFSYWHGVPHRGLEVYVRDRTVIFAAPTNDDLFLVFVAWPASELSAVRTDVHRHFMAALDRAPELAERIRGAQQAERYLGASDLPNFVRRSHGPGWALVGDAGCHKDPYMALGICDAFRDVEFLAGAMDDGLSGRQPMDVALAGYERSRDEAGRADFQENLERARFDPFPEKFYEFRAAIRGDEEAIRRFFFAREGMVPTTGAIPSPAR
jgi:flavin-dependent dehydrogenase